MIPLLLRLRPSTLTTGRLPSTGVSSGLERTPALGRCPCGPGRVLVGAGVPGPGGRLRQAHLLRVHLPAHGVGFRQVSGLPLQPCYWTCMQATTPHNAACLCRHRLCFYHCQHSCTKGSRRLGTYRGAAVEVLQRSEARRRADVAWLSAVIVVSWSALAVCLSATLTICTCLHRSAVLVSAPGAQVIDRPHVQ